MKTYIYPPSNSINRDLIKSNGEINCNTEEKSCAEDILRLFKNFISGSATVAQQKLAKLIFLKPSRLLILLLIYQGWSRKMLKWYGAQLCVMEAIQNGPTRGTSVAFQLRRYQKREKFLKRWLALEISLTSSNCYREFFIQKLINNRVTH